MGFSQSPQGLPKCYSQRALGRQIKAHSDQRKLWEKISHNNGALAATDSDGEKMTVTRVSGNIAGPIFGYSYL